MENFHKHVFTSYLLLGVMREQIIAGWQEGKEQDFKKIWLMSTAVGKCLFLTTSGTNSLNQLTADVTLK